MANRRRELVAAAGFGLLALLGLLLANAPLYNTPVYETLDLAANSLVIQDAKRLELLTGTYSRFGFFHPGPVALYVLAAGEVVFHDILRWVPSPVAGQVIAACFLNAAWIGLLAWLLARASGSIAAGAVAIAIFLAATVLRDPQYLVNLWLPYLHFLPFAVFTAALSRLASGSLDGLVALCLAGGFLVHGHVSFVAITGIMVVVGAIAYAAAARRSQGGPGMRLREDAREQRVSILASVAIACLYLAPIAANTVLNFPGEIPKYVAHKTGSGNALGPSLEYLARFWGGAGLFPLVAGLGAMAALALGRATRGLAIAAMAATLAAAFFTKVAIDDLTRPYLGFFYFAVVALVAATIGSFLVGRPGARRGIVSGMVFLAAIAVAAVNLRASNVWHSPLVPAIARHLLDTSPKPVILELDTSHEWEPLWGRIAGAAAEWVRRGERVACIHEAWHVLFTMRLRCTEADLRAGSRIFVTARDLPPDDATTAIGDLRFVALAPRVTPMGGQVMLTAADALERRRHLREGWSPERDFAWTLGPRAVLDLRVGGAGPLRLELDIAAFVPRPTEGQRVEVRANGKPMGTLEFTARRNHAARVLDLPDGVVGPDGVLRIELLVRQPVSPASVGQSADTRPLGAMLRSVRVLPPA